MMTEKSKMPVLYRGSVDPANPLARYQSSRAVRIVADRILALDSQGIEKKEAILVAQACLVHRLNPFPPRPEIHYWMDTWTDRNGIEQRRLNIMEHREATIRKAEENARRDGTYLEAPRFFHITEDVTKTSLGFDVNEKVCRCEVSDHRQVSEYYKQRLQFKDEGLDSKEIDKRIGKIPDHYVGYASLTPKEVADCKKAKFSAVNKLQKRAYTEALKQKWAPLVNMDEMVAGAPDDDDEYVIDTEWREAPIPEDIPFNGDDEPVDDGFDMLDKQRPYSPEYAKDRIGAKVVHYRAENRTHTPAQHGLAMGCLNLCFAGDDQSDSKRKSVLAYLFEVDSGKDIDAAQTLALLDWLEPTKDTGDAYEPNPHAVKEANKIVTARIKDLGQEILFPE